MIWLFLMGFMSFVAGSVISYLPAAKASPYYMLMWILPVAMGTIGWALVTKGEPNSSKLLVLGMYWDTLMQVTYLLIPVVIFSARLTLFQTAGIGLIFAGLFMIRG